jgi:hypothetical protein
MKQQTSVEQFGRRSRFMFLAAAVGALTFVFGLCLGALGGPEPLKGEVETLLMAQPASDAAPNVADFVISYVAPQ